MKNENKEITKVHRVLGAVSLVLGIIGLLCALAVLLYRIPGLTVPAFVVSFIACGLAVQTHFAGMKGGTCLFGLLTGLAGIIVVGIAAILPVVS